MTRMAWFALLIGMISAVIIGMSLVSCVPSPNIGTPVAGMNEEPAAIHLTRTAEAAAVQTIEAALAKGPRTVDVGATAQEVVSPTPEPTAMSGPAPTRPQIVVRHAINAYYGPGNHHAKAGQTIAGQILDVIARNPEGTWWRACCVEGEAVWIEAALVEAQGPLSDVPVVTITPPMPTLTPTPFPPTPVPTPTPQKAYIVVDGTYNVRAGPGTNYARMGQVQAGQTLEIITKNPDGTWWQVCCVDGRQVWIKADLVKAIGPTDRVPVAAGIPPTPTPEPQPSLACRGRGSMPPVTLLTPRPDLTCNGPVQFSWSWPHALLPGETFEVHIWPELKQTRTAVKQTSGTSTVINLSEDVLWIDWYNRPHRWEVVVVCLTDGHWVSRESEARLFYFWPLEPFDANAPQSNCK